MKNAWEKHGISEHFVHVHHYSSLQYQHSPETLEQFYTHCLGKVLSGENEQTFYRAYDTLLNLEQGYTLLDALCLSWKYYPLVSDEIETVMQYRGEKSKSKSKSNKNDGEKKFAHNCKLAS